MNTFNCVNLYLLVEQNPVIPNINNGANITQYIIWVNNCIYLIISCEYVWKHNNVKVQHVLLPDMGLEPVWYGLWINKVELKRKSPEAIEA